MSQRNPERAGLAALAVIAAVTVAACGSAAPPAPPASPTATAHAAAAPSPACTLKPSFDYIVRDDDPGASVTAQDIGNVNLASCTSALSDFQATAGQAPGECTTIALASRNPGYDVNAVPAPPLKDVIQAAGPGC